MYKDNNTALPDRSLDDLLRHVVDSRCGSRNGIRENRCGGAVDAAPPERSGCCEGGAQNRLSDGCVGERVVKSWGLVGYPLASAYSPIQNCKDLYEIEHGFGRGTIFRELDLPFLGADRKGGGCCGK